VDGEIDAAFNILQRPMPQSTTVPGIALASELATSSRGPKGFNGSVKTERTVAKVGAARNFWP
jgi:hypothetical protein